MQYPPKVKEELMITNNEVETSLMSFLLERYDLEGYEMTPIHEHEGGRNKIYLCHSETRDDTVIRVSNLDDRTKDDYLAELEFVRFLYTHGANVANVLDSLNHNLLEQIQLGQDTYTISCFQRAKGILLVENNYQYREGVPLSEYFFNCGKVLGKIHALSKVYQPLHTRYSFFERFNENHLEEIIPSGHELLLKRFREILGNLRSLEQNRTTFGMIHFDFGDSNYSIDFTNGNLTVYDFDNCCMGFYLYDLADVWTNGVGWVQFEPEATKRKSFMEAYFQTVLEGYRSENELDDSVLVNLPLFIDVTILESIVDAIETMLREDGIIEWDEKMIYLERCMVERIPYRGFFDSIYSPKHPFE